MLNIYLKTTMKWTPCSEYPIKIRLSFKFKGTIKNFIDQQHFREFITLKTVLQEALKDHLKNLRKKNGTDFQYFTTEFGIHSVLILTSTKIKNKILYLLC